MLKLLRPVEVMDKLNVSVFSNIVSAIVAIVAVCVNVPVAPVRNETN